jgi:protein-S-isoprenylcysteine O-methyltransferase Ste14
VLTVQSSPSAGSASRSQQAMSRSTRLALGVAVVALLILLAVIGGSAEHGAGAAQLRRGPASVVLSVMFTLAGLAGIGSLALLFWGLVTRNRRSLDRSEPKRHSPILVAGAALTIFACLTALLALAARKRHFQSLPALSGRPLSHVGPVASPLPFNAAASFTTSGIVVGVVVLVVMVKLVRFVGWRRALQRLRPLESDSGTAPEDEDARRPDLEALSMQLALMTVADPVTEPTRAVP